MYARVHLRRSGGQIEHAVHGPGDVPAPALGSSLYSRCLHEQYAAYENHKAETGACSAPFKPFTGAAGGISP